MKHYYDSVETALGTWLAAADDAGAIVAIELWMPGADPLASGRSHIRRMGALPDAIPLATAARQLQEYSAGERREFKLPLAPRGSAFQLTVWEGLRRIPYGTTCSYGQLAASIGLDPRAASRAVGAANGANPISVVVPCHRVIGANGSLVGYAGGLDMKRRLLEHEGALAPLLL